jgi:hypothetical protein
VKETERHKSEKYKATTKRRKIVKLNMGRKGSKDTVDYKFKPEKLSPGEQITTVAKAASRVTTHATSTTKTTATRTKSKCGKCKLVGQTAALCSNPKQTKSDQLLTDSVWFDDDVLF